MIDLIIFNLTLFYRHFLKFDKKHEKFAILLIFISKRIANSRTVPIQDQGYNKTICFPLKHRSYKQKCTLNFYNSLINFMSKNSFIDREIEDVPYVGQTSIHGIPILKRHGKFRVKRQKCRHEFTLTKKCSYYII